MDIKQEHNEDKDGYKHLVKTGAYYPVSIKAEPHYIIDRTAALLIEGGKTQHANTPQTEVFDCVICGEFFEWKESLAQHMKKHGSDDKKMETASQSCMIMVKQETDDTTYCLDQLSHINKFVKLRKKRTTYVESELTEEIKTQQRVYAPRAGGYNCTICGYTFKWKKTLEQHMKKHEADNKQVEATTENCMVKIKQETDDFEEESDLLSTSNLSHIKMEPADDITDTCETQTTEGKDNTDVEVEIKQETEDVVVGSIRPILTHVVAPVDYESVISNTRPLEDIPKNKPNGYKCGICSVVFKRESMLISHFETHKDKTFICSVCGYFSPSIKYLRVHQKCHTTTKGELDECTALEKQLVRRQRHTDETPDECSLFGYKIARKPHVWDLMSTKTSVKPFECDYCDFKTTTEKKLWKHRRRHTGDTPYVCSMCTYKTTFKSRLKTHMAIHTDEIYNCTRCGFKTKHRSSLLLHLRRHGSRRYKCSACDFKAVTKYILSCHEKRHTIEKPYGCSLCGYVTFNKSCLTMHMRRHANDKTGRCSMRGFRTMYEAVLERHELKLQTGEEPYGCSMCEFTTCTQSVLAAHLMIHSGVKPYECFLCDFKTASKKYLTAHEKKHNGEEVHVCYVCRYKTHSKGHLTIHMRKAH